LITRIYALGALFGETMVMNLLFSDDPTTLWWENLQPNLQLQPLGTQNPCYQVVRVLDPIRDDLAGPLHTVTAYESGPADIFKALQAYGCGNPPVATVKELETFLKMRDLQKLGVLLEEGTTVVAFAETPQGIQMLLAEWDNGWNRYAVKLDATNTTTLPAGTHIYFWGRLRSAP
jgi:hypothetical protein